ncbi:hypothetical protein PIB30_083769 [Stylosanthes scabra]|uniref:Uncharacterized protein n=1 Tax=Stylosanthes scabra TaxID=79078 RepID=A0ABU6VTE4_9FABA|nr:hypothetical protein [Stylosanthes scabra]
MASLASFHTNTEINATSHQSSPLLPSQHEVPHTSQITVPHSAEAEQHSLPIMEATVVSHSASLKEKASSKEKKKKKKAEDKKIVPAPPKFLVADTVAPLNEEGFLKAPEPSIETSDLWSSQARGFRTAPQQEARNLLSKWKARLRSAYRDVWIDCGTNQALQLATCELS